MRDCNTRHRQELAVAAGAIAIAAAGSANHHWLAKQGGFAWRSYRRTQRGLRRLAMGSTRRSDAGRVGSHRQLRSRHPRSLLRLVAGWAVWRGGGGHWNWRRHLVRAQRRSCASRLDLSEGRNATRTALTARGRVSIDPSGPASTIFADSHCLNKTVTQRKWLPQIKCCPESGRQSHGRRHQQDGKTVIAGDDCERRPVRRGSRSSLRRNGDSTALVQPRRATGSSDQSGGSAGQAVKQTSTTRRILHA